MSTCGGIITNAEQNALDANFEPIPGLYVSGNDCGRRFGVEYITPTPGVSLGMAIVSGSEAARARTLRRFSCPNRAGTSRDLFAAYSLKQAVQPKGPVNKMERLFAPFSPKVFASWSHSQPTPNVARRSDAGAPSIMSLDGGYLSRPSPIFGQGIRPVPDCASGTRYGEQRRSRGRS